uniref:RRM domain-containing protein n=1 Tax=Parascaris univalens TaxID=6257 RepID=A0A915A3I6_PARUN
MSRKRPCCRADEGTTLYVRQVHYAARPEDLRTLFERMGPVRDVYIPLDYYTHESRGFAYVKYEYAGDAERAYKQLHGCAILGRRIAIDWAQGERKTKAEMREKEEMAHARCERGRRRSSSSRRRSRESSSSSRSRTTRRSNTRSSSVRRMEHSAPRSPSVRCRKERRRSCCRCSTSSVHGSGRYA